ncbi:MAG: cytochrome c biogenesis protein CcsA [Sphingomonadaceae bacterium]
MSEQPMAVDAEAKPTRDARERDATGLSRIAGRSKPDLIGWSVAPAMVVALYFAFLYAPTEATMGDVQRIFYFHVPAAWVGFLSFAVVFAASIQWLRTRRHRWDALAASGAEVGVLFTTVALLTGSIWAKPTWGTWWDWDPRLTTTLILWLIYVSYLMLRSAVENPSKRASLAAVVGIVGFVDVPIVFMSIRWWRTIHPVVITSTSLELDPRMVTTLVVCLAAFTLLFVHLLRLRTRLELQREEVYRLRDHVLYEE